jgi:hypothetical protein
MSGFVCGQQSVSSLKGCCTGEMALKGALHSEALHDLDDYWVLDKR